MCYKADVCLVKKCTIVWSTATIVKLNVWTGLEWARIGRVNFIGFHPLEYLFKLKWTFVHAQNKMKPKKTYCPSDAQPSRLNVNSLATIFINTPPLPMPPTLPLMPNVEVFSFHRCIIYLFCYYFHDWSFGCCCSAAATMAAATAQEWHRKRLKSDELALIGRSGKYIKTCWHVVRRCFAWSGYANATV